MIKRTTGRLLLTLLVVTGLAGTLNNSSLSPKERKQAITLVRNSRKLVLESLEGLSVRQLKYRGAHQDLSIADLILIMTARETRCTEQIRDAMQKPANSETRLKIALTDEQLLINDNYSLCKHETDQVKVANGNDIRAALDKLSALQNEHIKYLRTSTEDLRNHVVQTSAGWIDCYQYYLLLADQDSYFAERIRQARAQLHFPKK